MSYLHNLLYPLDPKEIAAHNKFIAHTGEINKLLEELPLDILGCKACKTTKVTPYVALLEGPGKKIEVALSADLLELLTPIFLSDVPHKDLNAIPELWVAYLLGDAICKSVLGAVLDSFRVVSIEDCPDFAQRSLVELEIRIAEQTIQIPIRVEKFDTSKKADIECQAAFSKMHWFPLPLVARLPEWSCAVRDFRDFDLGDVFLLREKSIGDLECRVFLGDQKIAVGTLKDGEIRVTNFADGPEDDVNLMGIDETQGLMPIGTESAELRLSDAKVCLSFILHSEVLSLKEISALSPGHTLKLNAHPDLELKIATADRIIGSGQLVAIGESVGVQITHWPAEDVAD